MSFAVWDFIFSRSSFKPVLPMAFTCAVQASTGASRRANRGCLRLGWCCFPTPPSNRPRIATQGRVLFSPQNELTPPPKGGGAGYRLLFSSFGFFTQRSPVLFRRKRRILRIRGLLSAVATGNCWSQTAHTGPTGRVCCFSGVVPLPGSHNRTQGRTGPNLVFTVFSF